MITQIISVLKLQKLTRVGPIFKNKSEWEKFQSSFGTLKAQYDFFFSYHNRSIRFFFLPIPLDMCFYMERTVNRANTDYVLCQYVILHNLRSAIQHYCPTKVHEKIGEPF